MIVNPGGHIRSAGGGGGGESISFIGSTTQALITATGTITLPTGLQEDDLVLVFGGRWLQDGHDLVAGWTERFDNGSSFMDYKFMGATPDSTYTASDSTSTLYPTGLVAIALRGVDTTTPFDVADQFSNGSSGMPDPPSITTVTDAAWVFAYGMVAATSISPAVQTGYSNFVSVETTGAFGANTLVSTKEISPAGADNPSIFGGTGSNLWVARSLALRPA